MNRFTRMISMFLIFALLVGCIPTVSASDRYTDVPQGKWYAQCADYCAENGILIGTAKDTFAPNATMTRAMFVTALYRLAGSPKLNRDGEVIRDDYYDTKKGSYYQIPLTWASQFFIVDGTGNGNFSPDSPITREQIACIIMRYLHNTGFDFTEDTYTLYPDFDTVSAYAKDSVEELCSTGLMIGDKNHLFRPKDNITRAEAAMVLMRLNEKLNHASENLIKDYSSDQIWKVTDEDAQAIQAIFDKGSFEQTGMPEFPAAYRLTVNGQNYYFESNDFYIYPYHCIGFSGKSCYGGLEAKSEEAIADMKEIYDILNRYIAQG